MTKVCQQKFEYAPDLSPTFQEPLQEPQFQEFAEVPSAKVPWLQTVEEGGAELATNTSLTCIRLDVEDLECFEVVDNQFVDLGVTFTNAVALTPSNPSYPPHSGTKVLMGAPKSGWLEATFLRPVHFVGAFVTSSRCAVLAAFDSNNQPIAQSKSVAANLAESGSKVPPNVQLSLSGKDIRRIRFYSFDGQMTVDDFSFSI